VGKFSRDKGGRAERELVHKHRDIGVPAQRVPLSGAVEGYKGDLIVAGLRAEVKARASGEGFKTLEGWLGDNDLLFLRRDRAEPLVVLPWKTWARVLGKPVAQD